MFRNRNITIKGNYNIVINGKRIVNGKETIEFGDEKNIYITIEGDCKDIKIESGDLEVRGSVNGNIKTVSGDIDVKSDVKGSINTISGDVDVGGSVGGSCRTISGDIDTNND